MMPDLAIAALMTSALATMMMMSSLNPEKALSAGTVPADTDASSARIATRSYRSLPQTKRIIVPARIPEASICGVVMVAVY